jgi:hypothetical protein
MQVYSEVMDQLTSLTQQREQVQEQLSKWVSYKCSSCSQNSWYQVADVAVVF